MFKLKFSKLIKKPKSYFRVKPNLEDYSKIYNSFNYKKHYKEIAWFKNKKLNAAYNAITKHTLTERKNKVALYWEGDNNEKKEFSFLEMDLLSNKFANILKKYKVKKQDRVFLFLPRVPEIYIAFMGILKTGAIAGTLFSAFGHKALEDRLKDSGAKIVVTTNELKKRVYGVKKNLPELKHIIIVDAEKTKKNEINYKKEMETASQEFKIAKTDPEDIAFMLYTSGTTGKPKGVIHAHLACLHEHMTAKYVLDIHDNDTYWCVTPETIIISNPKPKKINEIKVGDKVLGHNGKFCKVLDLFKRKYKGELVKIKTSYFDVPFFLTPNHSVLSGQRGKKAISWIPAGELTKEDFVLFPRLNITHDKEHLKLSDFFPNGSVSQGFFKKKKSKIKIKNLIKVNGSLMRLIGYYIAEGSISSHNRVVQFSFSKKEEHLADEVKHLLMKVFGLKSKKILYKNLFEIRLNSVVIAEFFKNLFGSRSYDKRLPSWALYLPEKKLYEFILGFWYGDGNTDRDCFRFHTTSQILTYQLRIILSKMGIISSVNCRKKENIPISKIGNRKIIPRNDCYCIRVGGRSLEKLSEILNKRHPFIDKRWCTYSFGKVSKNFIWIPIRKLERVPYNGEVFNIKTESNSYTLSNMAVHNCTADPGWVTGIAYGILGSWSLGASSLVYGGRFNPDKWYSLLQQYKVTVWYTAPTAIRMLMREGTKIVKKYNLKSLRHLCSVGEPLNPEAVKFSLKVFKRPFHDNYWQTETGGMIIANYPSMPIKPGSMGKPVPGIKAAIIDNKYKQLPPNKEGSLAIKPGWPSMMRSIWKNRAKYTSCFKKGWYITGDKAFKDKDGYFWFIGRADDVIKTAGERVGPFEVESALVEHPAIVEAGVIGKPDKLRGEIIKAFVTLKKGYNPSESLKKNLQKFTKKRLAGHAYPREIEFMKTLPKTRSGKIVRRVLKARELGQAIGDTSTLEKF